MAQKIEFMTNTLDLGGTERHLSLLLPELKARGMEVRIWCYRADNTFFYDLVAAGVPVISGRRMIFKLLGAGFRGDLGVIHTFMQRDSLWEVLLGRLFGRRVVRSARNAGHWRRNTLIERLKVGLRRRLVCRFIANSEQVVDYLAAAEGVPTREITLIENGTSDLMEAPPWLERKAVALSEKDFVLVAVERLMGRKNTAWLLEQVAALGASHPQVKLVVVGDGVHRGRLLKRAAVLDLGGRCRFVGGSSIPYAYLRVADVFVNASLPGSEGMSNSLLEAVMMGKPCVVSEGNRCGAVTEDKNAFFFSPDKAGAVNFHAAIGRLAEDSALREEMSLNSRKRYLEKYTLERQTNDYLDFYSRNKWGFAAPTGESSSAAIGT